MQPGVKEKQSNAGLLIDPLWKGQFMAFWKGKRLPKLMSPGMGKRKKMLGEGWTALDVCHAVFVLMVLVLVSKQRSGE